MIIVELRHLLQLFIRYSGHCAMASFTEAFWDHKIIAVDHAREMLVHGLNWLEQQRSLSVNTCKDCLNQGCAGQPDIAADLIRNPENPYSLPPYSYRLLDPTLGDLMSTLREVASACNITLEQALALYRRKREVYMLTLAGEVITNCRPGNKKKCR